MHGVLHAIQETYFIDAVIYTHSDELPDHTQRRDAFTHPIKAFIVSCPVDSHRLQNGHFLSHLGILKAALRSPAL